MRTSSAAIPALALTAIASTVFRITLLLGPEGFIGDPLSAQLPNYHLVIRLPCYETLSLATGSRILKRRLRWLCFH